ncbi:MAG: hypothetical protein ACD_21C00090G0014 [uncultured bacterium]|nr:MAG: hypothetical protein ACD_21C00090G0014 [uncultured bacterium]
MILSNNLKKYFWRIAIFVALIMFQTVCNANTKRAVNILTWYDYLRDPEISLIIKDKCGVEISYDEYFHSSECLGRIFSTRVNYNYDIAIFPGYLYYLIKKEMKVKHSTLNEVAKEYSTTIKEHYLSNGYPSNVAYFTIAVSGFVWNTNIIHLSKDDTIYSMLKKAKNNIVILMNAISGIWGLFDDSKSLSGELIAEKFKNAIQGADIYITNGYNVLYNKDNFAFAFQWSGDAICAINASKSKKLDFLEHSKYSNVTIDLLAELNDKKDTQCVAKVLASKKVLDIVQKKTFYLSPYSTYKSIDDPVFQSAYRPLFDGAHKKLWRRYVVDLKWEKELRSMWYTIHMLPQVIKNHSLVLRHKSD